MLCLSTAISNLDSTGVAVAYNIAKSGRVDEIYISSLEEKYKVNFLSISPANPAQGDIVDFVITREYDPLILSNDVITLKTSRTTVIGYYG